MNKNTNFERIAQFLRDEGIPKTPHEISVWTGISLNCVYYILQNNRNLFEEIFDGDSLKGWTIDKGYF
jgi:hypothetical protein